MDQILYTSFQVHALVGIAVVGGALLLIVPALAAQRTEPDNREVHAVFGVVWLGMVVAAALGNYPTPIVGYGGSAILGYALSLSLLPSKARSAAAVRGIDKEGVSTESTSRPHLRIGAERGIWSPRALHL